MSEGDRQKWDARHGTRGPEATAPSAFVVSLSDALPTRGRALDVAGGSGRNALWLARRGLAVTVVDVSQVGLELARAAAGAAGVDLQLVAADLDIEPLPSGPFDVIVCVDYLRRELFAAFAAALVPGGLLTFQQATRSNLQRHAHPSARFLLDDAELPSLLRGLSLEIIRHEEGWLGALGAERHEARLLARKV